MSSSRFRPDFYRTVAHPLMSISLAVPAVLSGTYLLLDLLGSPHPSAAVIAAIVCAPIVEAVIGNILYKERAAPANRLRELLIYLIVVYIVLSLLGEGPFMARFIPSARQTVPLIPALFAWLIGYTIHDRLRGRESLLRSISGKRYDALRRAIFDRQHDMALTVKEMRSASKLIVLIFILLSVFAAIGASGLFEGPRVFATSAGFMFFVLFSVDAALIIGAFNGFIDEYAANGEGVSVPARFQRRRLVVAAALVLLVVLLASILSRDHSVLPLRAIIDFFARLLELLRGRRNRPPLEIVGSERSLLDPSLQLRNMLTELEYRLPPLWLRILGRLLQRLLAAVLVTGVAIFVFGPLFSPAFRAALRRIRPGKFLSELWQRFVQRLRLIWRVLRAGPWKRRHKSVWTEDTPPESEPHFSRRFRPSLRKKRQMDRVLTVFAAVIRWGADHGLVYSRPMTAREYLRRVPEIVPECYVDVQTLCDVFYEARFSTHLLGFHRMREYVQAAKRITRGRATAG
jgi:hypothetical protein